MLLTTGTMRMSQVIMGTWEAKIPDNVVLFKV